MRHFLYLVVIVSLFINKAVSASTIHAQAVSVNVSDAMGIGGYKVNAIGNDPTMATASATSIIVSQGVLNFVIDTVPAMAHHSISLTTTGVGASTYDNATGILNIPLPYVPTNFNATHALSGTVTYTISTTKFAAISYCIQISCTATIGAASSGSVALSYSIDGGSTYTVVGTVANSNTVTLAVALNSVSINTASINFSNIPANALCKLVTTSAGTTTITSIKQTETY